MVWLVPALLVLVLRVPARSPSLLALCKVRLKNI
jgi:hypothetical protein